MTDKLFDFLKAWAGKSPWSLAVAAIGVVLGVAFGLWLVFNAVFG